MQNKKIITDVQIENILQVIYGTSIPVSQFDALRKMLSELPDVETKKEE